MIFPKNILSLDGYYLQHICFFVGKRVGDASGWLQGRRAMDSPSSG